MDQSTILDTYESQGRGDFFLTGQGLEYIRETAKWAKFLAIVGFVFIGLMVVFSFLFGTVFSTMLSQSAATPGMPGAGMSSLFIIVFYLIIAVIYFFPVLYLFRYATKTQAALASGNNEQMMEGFGNLKSMFKFMGIFTIIILGFYALAIVIGIFGGLASAF